jgi:hypothetical protein
MSVFNVLKAAGTESNDFQDLGIAINWIFPSVA